MLYNPLLLEMVRSQQEEQRNGLRHSVASDRRPRLLGRRRRTA